MQAQTKVLQPFRLGCGVRRTAVYLYSDTKKYFEEYPQTYFLFDPPVVIEDPGQWGISPQGLSYVEMNGITHVYDWIGGDYPNAADIIEEGFQKFGSTLAHSGTFSLPDGFKKLIPGKSRRLLVHPKGYLTNPKPYRKNYIQVGNRRPCVLPVEDPNHKKHIEDSSITCAGLHWQTVTGGDTESGTRKTYRKLNDVFYEAVKPIEDIPPVFKVALVAWWPIDEVHVPLGDEQDKINKILGFLQDVNMPVYCTNL